MNETEILEHAALALVLHKIADGLEEHGHDREKYLEHMREEMGEDFRRIETTFMEKRENTFDEMIDLFENQTN